MKYVSLWSLLAILAIACTPSEKKSMETSDTNPFYSEWDTPYGVPPFDQIQDAHYLPAFKEGMKQQLAEVDAIANNEAAPTFDNTIGAYEKSGQLLSNVSGVFFTLTGAHTNDQLRAAQKEVSPLLSSHNDNIFLNENFFNRVKILFEDKDNLELSVEQNKLLENYYNRFVRSGAALNFE